MATPLAAAVAALIWSQNPGWTASQIVQQLYDSADDIYGLPCNSSYAGKLGAGRINAYQAVSVIVPQCGIDSECDDGDSCTTDTCNSGICENMTIGCGAQDDLCCSGCDRFNDPDCPEVCGDGYCAGQENGEDCTLCSADCISGEQFEEDCTDCFKGRCDGQCNPKKDGPTCPDCTPSPQFYCCGDGACEGEETVGNCAVDCGCSSDAFCDDGEDCTTDICGLGTGLCSNIWPECGLNDGCCGPNCTSDTDSDCVISACIPTPDCNCNGKCGKKEDKINCPDCW